MLTRYRLLPTLLAALVLTTSTACATSGYGRYPGPGPRVVDDRAYRFGYDSGVDQGRDDASRGRSFNVNRHGEYRSATRGYDGYGNRNQYRDVFRRGFAAGYEDGYRRNNGNARNGSYDNRRQGGIFNDNRGGVYRSPAADNGFRDGYNAGRDDARGGDRYDARRDKRYREGDNGYDNRYGSRDAYKDQYRNAFQQGYDRGYREVRR